MFQWNILVRADRRAHTLAQIGTQICCSKKRHTKKRLSSHREIILRMGLKQSKSVPPPSPSNPDKKVLFIRHEDQSQYILFEDFSMVKIQGCVYRWYKSGHPMSKTLTNEYFSMVKFHPGIALRR